MSGDLPDRINGKAWLRRSSPALVRATPANKQRAISFVRSLTASGWTFTCEALRRAFRVEGADLIVLLSDGLPREIHRGQGREFTKEEVLAELQAQVS